MKRFFIKKEKLNTNNTIEIIGNEYNYIKNVIRLKKNDNLIVFNGDGYEYKSQIIQEKSKSICIKIIEAQRNDLETKPNVDLFQSIIKTKNLDTVVQKSVELGVKAIVPFISEYTTVKPRKSQKDKLFKIAASAMEQSGRNYNISVANEMKIDGIIDKLSDYDAVFLFYEKSDKKIDDLDIDWSRLNNIAIIIGPEGGFSKNDLIYLAKIIKLSKLSLGKRVLRAETAAISAISLVMHKLGEF